MTGTFHLIVRAARHALIVVAAFCAGAAHAQRAQVPVASLDGRDGFTLFVSQPYLRMGTEVGAAGDFNGDGIDDLIVGAPASEYRPTLPGVAYVVFGRRSGMPAFSDLDALDGTHGVALHGEAAGDLAGTSVAGVGDVNGDGVDDVLIGAPAADANGNADSGRAYVVFGRRTAMPASIALSALDGSNGFKLDGEAAGNRTGTSVEAAGDVNGDGFDDIVIGAPGANTSAGRSYVLFGRPGFTSPLPLSGLDGADGFKILGTSSQDNAGHSVASAGDINADGHDDVVIVAPHAGQGTAYGHFYVIFGRSSGFSATLQVDALTQDTGFVLTGGGHDTYIARAGAGGDFDGDGVDDLVLGVPFAGNPGDQTGQAFVVHGHEGSFAPTWSLSFIESIGDWLRGIANHHQFGIAVDLKADINGDGINDLVVGSTPVPDGQGRAYVVFGRAGRIPSGSIETFIDGVTGFEILAEEFGDRTGSDVGSAGDLNGDGLDDLVVGAPLAHSDGAQLGASEAGRSFVVFGSRIDVFRDGIERENLVRRHPRLDVRATPVGSAVRWHSGAHCHCNVSPFDINLFAADGELAFSWPSAGTAGAVLSGSGYAVLEPGAEIGPDSTFGTSVLASATSAWRAGATGYLGFRFDNPDTGRVNYGYARLQTTAPTGFPARLVEVVYNRTGESIRIPID